MMRVMTMVAVCALVGVALAEGEKKPLTADEKAARRERIMMKTGGFIYDKRESAGSCVFVNTQKRVHPEVVQLQAERLMRDVMFELEVRGGEPVTMFTAADAFKALKANAAVFLVDDAALPSITVVPESRWAILNVGALADGCDEKTLAQRTAKEMSRALAFVFGSGYATTNVGPHIPVFAPADLDWILMQTLPMEVASPIQIAAERKFGIRCFKRAFYSSAYEAGWAPEPSNKYQESARRRVDYKRAYLAGKNEPPTEDWQRDVIRFVDTQLKNVPDRPLKIKYEKK